jgi:hypothetical protein
MSYPRTLMTGLMAVLLTALGMSAVTTAIATADAAR